MQGIGDTTQARGDIGLRGVPDQVDGGDQVDPVGADPLHVQIADPFDLVVLLTISNTVQNAIIGDDVSVSGGLISAATLLVINHFVVAYLYSHERLDQLIEGNPDVLIENGRVLTDRLKRELITLPELEAAAHRQGFASLDELDRAVLEPGGSICFFARKPTPEDARHAEVLARLDAIQAQLAR